jgi:potassium channel subfamily K, other eukaryote
VFEHAEHDQDWSYFESLYFSYTTLLTIGYGDFEPMSNSGKPFFVFWSLLAVPTLTILISDMGDTVVKGVKDATIWLGEVTVLPSDEDTFSNRLKHGVAKATLGKLDLRRTPEDVEKDSGDSGDETSNREMHPGLTRLFRNGREKHRHPKEEMKTNDRLAADFEAEEERDEEDARKKGEKWEEDEHHYRHVLIGQLRKFYADAQATTPKKYSYEDWQYFLRLLGEKEDDPSYHRKAPTNAEEEKEINQAEGSNGQERPDQETQDLNAKDPSTRGKGYTSASEASDNDGPTAKWSWIGAQSPLMGDKEEAEWLLERFFQRLEESLRSDANRNQTRQGQEYKTGLHEAERERDASSSSERTVSRN